MAGLLDQIEDSLLSTQALFSDFAVSYRLEAELKGTRRSKITVLYTAKKNSRGVVEYFATVQYYRSACDMVEFLRSETSTRDEIHRLMHEGVTAAMARSAADDEKDLAAERQSLVNRLAELDARVK